MDKSGFINFAQWKGLVYAVCDMDPLSTAEDSSVSSADEYGYDGVRTDMDEEFRNDENLPLDVNEPHDRPRSTAPNSRKGSHPSTPPLGSSTGSRSGAVRGSRPQGSAGGKAATLKSPFRTSTRTSVPQRSTLVMRPSKAVARGREAMSNWYDDMEAVKAAIGMDQGARDHRCRSSGGNSSDGRELDLGGAAGPRGSRMNSSAPRSAVNAASRSAVNAAPRSAVNAAPRSFSSAGAGNGYWKNKWGDDRTDVLQTGGAALTIADAFLSGSLGRHLIGKSTLPSAMIPADGEDLQSSDESEHDLREEPVIQEQEGRPSSCEDLWTWRRSRGGWVADFGS